MSTFKKYHIDWFCVLILCLGIRQSLPAQIAAALNPDAQFVFGRQASNVFRVNADLVTVPVSVTNSKGSSVFDLDMKDFRIEEDGSSETILTLAQAGQSPLQMVLLFDLSGSLHSRFEFEQHAAIHFLEKVWKSEDTVSIITFGERPEVRLQTSKSLDESLQILSGLRPTESSTAFLDSVELSTLILRQSAAPGTRRALVVLSDGEDNASDCRFSDVLRAVQQSDIIFYSINPGGASIRLNEISLKGQEVLTSLADKTGGTAFVSDKAVNLDGIFGRIATELRAQYLLSYYSSNPHVDGKFRQITVSVPTRPDLRLHARQGYYAMQQ
jgi:Ca-activated chloride channel family protein